MQQKALRPMITAVTTLTTITTITTIMIDNLLVFVLLGAVAPGALGGLNAVLETVLDMNVVAGEGFITFIVESFELVGKFVICGTDVVTGVSRSALGVPSVMRKAGSELRKQKLALHTYIFFVSDFLVVLLQLRLCQPGCCKVHSVDTISSNTMR